MSRAYRFAESAVDYHNHFTLRITLVVVIGVSGFNLITLASMQDANPARVHDMILAYSAIAFVVVLEPFLYGMIRELVGGGE